RLGIPTTASSRTPATARPVVMASFTPPPPTATAAPSPTPSATATVATPPPKPSAAAPVPVATVKPPTPAPTRTPAPTATPTGAGLPLTVSAATPGAGEQNVMSGGRGFDASRQYQIYWVQGTGGQVLFGPASPDGAGSFSSPVRIPTGARPGTATVAACVYP